jgi:hypothetical protein
MGARLDIECTAIRRGYCRMPMHWIIDSGAKLVTLVAEGDVSLKDAAACIAAVQEASATPYRKLLDGRTGSSSMSDEELLMVGAEIRASHGHGKVGALAVVALPDQTANFGRLLGALAAANRNMKMFEDRGAAELWLAEQPDA